MTTDTWSFERTEVEEEGLCPQRSTGLSQAQLLSIDSLSCEPGLLCQEHVLSHGHIPVTEAFC